MDYKTLCNHQRKTLSRLYCLVDELELLVESVDTEEVSSRVNTILMAITVEIEGMEEAVKEYNGV